MLKVFFWVFCGALLASAATYEARTSWLQSHLFSQYAADMTWKVERGPSPSLILPAAGPYNERQGYTTLSAISQNLRRKGFEITHQARFSPALVKYVGLGGNPPYHEKQQAGLTILDHDGNPVYVSNQPQRIYHHYEQIPTLLIDSLLFIENRGLVDDEFPNRNPAVEWRRLGKVLAAHTLHMFDPDRETAGASTLATQLEKYRYSPEGLTSSAEEKLQQMISASMRAYLDGPDTSLARRRIVRDYINSTPLSGRAGFGEVQGIGEGLWAWYGIDFNEANAVLTPSLRSAEVLTEQARVFKAALSLLLSQRRPSYYLQSAREELAQLTDSYLRVLGAAGVIDRNLQNAALRQPLIFREGMPTVIGPSFSRQKAINNTRTQLLTLLGMPSLYDLDRMDVTAKTTVVTQVQRDVEQVLEDIVDPARATEMGLTGYRLLDVGQLDAVRFSVLLYESTSDGNKLRVQTDNLNMPFDLNDGSKLDLGSTAKLRTLITYLDVVETLYHRLTALPRSQLLSASVANDPIRLWVVEQLRANPNLRLQELLDAAMLRPYSASPAEAFFTAGGQHRFTNFENSDNGKVMPLADGFNRSVNLVFIRLMRDISRFYINEIPGIDDLLQNGESPRRQEYLARFADHEGREYLQRFYNTYRSIRGAELVSTLAQRTPAVPYRLAMAFRSVRPDADIDQMAAFMAQRLDKQLPDGREMQKLYDQYGKEKFNSNDRAYLAGMHPLELWMVDYLLNNPQANFDELVRASTEERQEAYAWLFKTNSWDKQQSRIRILVEQDAFEAIHRQWQRVGYPFPTLVPSYATALGVSADRPSALTELVGIVVNDGLRLPMFQIDSLHFGVDTPYETRLAATPGVGERVLSREVSRTARRALMGIVESGTGRRLSGVFRGLDGQPLAVGGKTGTGDHRSRRFGAGGQLIEETVVNRNALFTFFIDDRFFGTILASVGGEQARNFEFTSGLATQLLKVLEPALQPLLYPEGELLSELSVDAVAQAAP